MEVIDGGNGELLAWHDPEEHREWVRKNKCLSMEKSLDLHEAFQGLCVM